MTRIIVTGGRDYADRAAVFAALDRVHAKSPITVLVHGACRRKVNGKWVLQGADRWADEWAVERGVTREQHPADFDGPLGKGAGPSRNELMAYRGAAGLIAFPGNEGTADMTRRARNHEIPVWRPYAR